MKVEAIIESVRYCIDEEAANVANFADAPTYDYGGDDNDLMNHIIKAKIGDALRWICLYAPADLLGGSDEKDSSQQPISTGILVDKTATPIAITGTNGGKIVLPQDFVKIARVRTTGWYRAVKVLLTEDSDEYLQLRDDSGAAATADRPQAVLIEKSTREIEVWPTGASVEYTYVANVEPKGIEGTGGEIAAYALPPRVKTSFIYYLAFLLLSAYGDERSGRMLEIAMQNLKITNKQ